MFAGFFGWLSRRGFANNFGKVLAILPNEDRERRMRRRLLVHLAVSQVDDFDLLLKSNVTRYVKMLAESYARDLGGDKNLERERTFLAGRIYETELLLKNMEVARKAVEENRGTS